MLPKEDRIPELVTISLLLVIARSLRFAAVSVRLVGDVIN